MMDECGFMTPEDFEDGVNSAIYPTLNSTRGTMLMCSTLPKSQSHPYWERVLKARLDLRSIEGTINDCPRYTKVDIDKFADRVGGRDSVDFRREFLNEMITNEEFAVIPEASSDLMDKITKEVDTPSHFDAYVSMDIGFRDYTALVFGYFDFLRNRVVIQDEVIMKGTRVTTSSIADAIREKELTLWGTKKPYMRVADNNNLILLNELTQHPYNLPIFPTAKDNREAAIIQREQIIIHPRCVNLKQHIQYATWNNKKTDFDRDPLNGHWDLLISLVYMCRNIQYQKNPYPPEYMMTSEAFYVDMSSHYDKPKSDFEAHIKSIFTPLAKSSKKS
jgi:hypothetical protein